MTGFLSKLTLHCANTVAIPHVNLSESEESGTEFVKF